MSYKKALKKLESIPPGERQLAAGRYVWEVKNGKSHCGCAIGKLLTESQRVRLFAAPAGAGFFEKPNESGVSMLRRFLGLLPRADSDSDSGLAGMTLLEAQRLQVQNDHCRYGGNNNTDRKARYKSVIAWLKKRVAKPDPEFTL